MFSGDVYSTLNDGDLVVVSDNGWDNVLVRFLSTGYETTTRRQHIESGSVKDRLLPSVFGVGYIGGLKHKSYKDGAETKSYRTWFGMMQRCYSGALHRIRPTYKDCAVCDEWHNFQNFAEWYKINYPNTGSGYELDKDIKVDGNRIYSPEMCEFVTKKDNIMKSQEGRMYTVNLISPEGKLTEVKNQSEFARMNGMAAGNINKLVHGKITHCGGWTKA